MNRISFRSPSRPAASRALPLCALAVVIVTLLAGGVEAGNLYRIDTLGSDFRMIPDVSGNPGDSILISESQVIDILILGDGYLASEESLFLSSLDTVSALSWYQSVFGGGSSEALRPFGWFKNGFRVWALFEPSPERVSQERNSHYRVMLNPENLGQIGKKEWWSDSAKEPDQGFRDSLFKSIDEVADSLNLQRYPDSVDNRPTGSFNRRYRNMYVVMIARADTAAPYDAGDDFRPSGRSFPVPRVLDIDDNLITDKVKVGIGAGEVHEWGHTFGYLVDEYILERGSVSPDSNAHPDSISIWNLSNIVYTNFPRCEPPWQHLAPGGKYNPKIRSLIGNLWVGSSSGQYRSWHSEYMCQINGGVGNYPCNIEDADTAWLRDSQHYCFWCEEIMSIRILERFGEFDRLDPGALEFNTQGRAWWDYWETTLRDQYYSYFNYDSLIAAKNLCYALYDPANTCTGCENDCNDDDNPWPTCLPYCGIREYGNGVYVDPVLGGAGNPGTKNLPVASIADGVFTAQLDCAQTPIIILRPGSYSGAVTISDPALLITDDCSPVVVGK